MTGLVSLWSHLLAAALYGALTIWQLRHWNGDPRNRPLVTAFAAIAVWAIFLALLGPYALMSQFAECARNLAFLAFLYGILQGAGESGRQRGVKLVYAAVAGVVGLQIVVGGLLHEFPAGTPVFAALADASLMLGLIFAAGALVLVHNLYGQAAPDSRQGLQLPMLALSAMWTYDLHLYTVAYLSGAPGEFLFAARGVALALLVPLFALATRRAASWKVRLSRAATFQSLSVLAILAYLLMMMSATRALELAGEDWSGLAQITILLGMTVIAAVLLPSPRARAWLRVMTVKHLFEHRYDYREEWLRFTRTVAWEGQGGAPIEERIAKALADLGGSPAALLLLANDRGRLCAAGGWNWAGTTGTGEDDGGALARFLAETGHVIEFAEVDGGKLRRAGKAVAVPASIAGLEGAWAGIPLVHAGKLLGLVVLRHPPFRRPLDWEDFDLFRAAGTQAASYLAEARKEQALAEAQRFEDFNRRFAFILHDVKNLVSQLSLVARNAERHAGNPEFQTDMIATLQSSVQKMKDLLARLSNGAPRSAEPPRPTPIRPMVAAMAAARRRQHPVEVLGEAGLVAMAAPAALEQALVHLVQNAIDASPPNEPVRICFAARDGDVAIDVVDAGPGIPAEFVRTRLFQPFASTKQGGFGIGAFEARSLVEAMGGRIEVDSRPGEGSRFTILLPRAAAAPPQAEPERISA